MIEKQPKVYEKDNHIVYHCDIRSAENLEKIYEARRYWVKGLYEYTHLLAKEEIVTLLDTNLIAIEGLEEISEEDLKKLQ